MVTEFIVRPERPARFVLDTMVSHACAFAAEEMHTASAINPTERIELDTNGPLFPFDELSRANLNVVSATKTRNLPLVYKLEMPGFVDPPLQCPQGFFRDYPVTRIAPQVECGRIGTERLSPIWKRVFVKK